MLRVQGLGGKSPPSIRIGVQGLWQDVEALGGVGGWAKSSSLHREATFFSSSLASSICTPTGQQPIRTPGKPCCV